MYAPALTPVASEFVARMCGEVEAALVKFAAAGPNLTISPNMRSTKLASVNDKLEPSPKSMAAKLALSAPSKKGLQEYEKHLSGHEALLKKSLSQLDKDIENQQEQLERDKALQLAMEARLAKKQKAREARAEKGREAGAKKGRKMAEMESPVMTRTCRRPPTMLWTPPPKMLLGRSWLMEMPSTTMRASGWNSSGAINPELSRHQRFLTDLISRSWII